jgi:hypothetical protein
LGGRAATVFWTRGAARAAQRGRKQQKISSKPLTTNNGKGNFECVFAFALCMMMVRCNKKNPLSRYPPMREPSSSDVLEAADALEAPPPAAREPRRVVPTLLEMVPIATVYLVWVAYGQNDAVRRLMRCGWMLHAPVAFALAVTLWLTARRARARGAAYAHAAGGAEILYALGTLRALERLQLSEVRGSRWLAVTFAGLVVAITVLGAMMLFLTTTPPAPQCPEPICFDDAEAIDDAQQRGDARDGAAG